MLVPLGSGKSVSICNRFYAPQLYLQVLLRHVLAIGILSVCLSVCHDPVVYQAQVRDSGSPPYDSLEYDSLESLVSNEVIWCQWVRRFPSNEGIKEGYPP